MNGARPWRSPASWSRAPDPALLPAICRPARREEHARRPSRWHAGGVNTARERGSGGATMAANATGQTLVLSATEVEILRATIEDALADLREEIYKTENYDLRQELKEREQALAAVLSRLGAQTSAGS